MARRSKIFEVKNWFDIIIAGLVMIFFSILTSNQSRRSFSNLGKTENIMNKSLKTFGYGQLKTDPCNVTINLPYFENENGNSLGGQQLFFLETSGARGLSGRQVCSVESAALHSQIGRIHLLFKSTQIDLNKRKSMCELYHNYKNVHFYTLNFTRLFEQTPVEGIEKRIRMFPCPILILLS